MFHVACKHFQQGCDVQSTQLADPQMPSIPRLHKLVLRLLLFADSPVQSLLLQMRQVVKPRMPHANDRYNMP